MRHISLLALAFAMAATGCTAAVTSGTGSGSGNGPNPPPPQTYSGTVPTNDMWPSMSAQTQGNTVTVYAAVLQNGSGFLTLNDGDYFTASVGGDAALLSLEPNTSGGVVHYTANFASPSASAPVTIAFERAAPNASAPSTRLELASPFEIASPTPSTFVYGTTLSIAIAPAPVAAPGSSTDFWSVDIVGPCIAADHGPTMITPAADGTILFDTSTIPMVQGSPGCAVNVQIRHETRGTADPAYASGADIEGLQARLFASELTLH